MFFAYSLTMEFLERFLIQQHKIKPIRRKIEENFLKIWEREMYQNISREDIARKILNDLLMEGAFHITAPPTHMLCKNYSAGKCYEKNKRRGCQYEGDCYLGNGVAEYYMKEELLVDADPKAAVLVNEPEKIYGFPIYCNGKQPLLLVRTDKLVIMFNSELYKFCSKHKIREEPFTESKLHRILFEINACMFNSSRSDEKKTFIFEIRLPQSHWL